MIRPLKDLDMRPFYNLIRKDWPNIRKPCQKFLSYIYLKPLLSASNSIFCGWFWSRLRRFSALLWEIRTHKCFLNRQHYPLKGKLLSDSSASYFIHCEWGNTCSELLHDFLKKSFASLDFIRMHTGDISSFPQPPCLSLNILPRLLFISSF